jgi:ATP-dependent DNA ligase
VLFNGAAALNRRRQPSTKQDRGVDQAPVGALPAWIAPQLSALVKQAPDGDAWLHEIKYDGYRMHARLDAGRVNILTRRPPVTGGPSTPEKITDVIIRGPIRSVFYLKHDRRR